MKREQTRSFRYPGADFVSLFFSWKLLWKEKEHFFHFTILFERYLLLSNNFERNNIKWSINIIKYNFSRSINHNVSFKKETVRL